MSRLPFTTLGIFGTTLAGPAVAIAVEPAGAAAEIQYTLTISRHLVVQYAEECEPADVWWGADGTGVTKVVLTWTLPEGSVQYRETAAPGEVRGLGTGCPGRDERGRSALRVTAYDSSGKALGHQDEWFYQKFNTTITGFNAAPEPVRVGRTITVSGRLLRLDYAPKVGYHSYAGKTIRIYFRNKGGTTWSYVGSTTTGVDGRFTKGFAAKRDGHWRTFFPGTGWHDGQTSASDYVDVI